MPRTKNETPRIERPKRVTLQDIADVAGVKKMVVSNALNGTRSVAPATREKVQQIARELNYIPNFAARALTTGRTGIIAILSGRLSEPYYASMVDLLERHINADGFHLMLMRTPSEVKDLVNATGNIAVDGAIAVDMLGLVNEFRSQSSIPCVSIGTAGRSFVDNVIVDLSEGIDEALRLMIASGRRRIAYLVTALEMETEVRARTYLEAMRRANHVPEIINVSTDDSEAVERKFKVHIIEHGCPDALQCQNDETAMCALRVFKDLGYKVPTDVLLAGCDGQRHMRYFDPPLSTIVQPMEEMCALAWQFLQRRIAEPARPHQTATFQGKLLVTESLIPTFRASSCNGVPTTQFHKK
ncbi:transcriptional regulator, LacI family [Abditibacterium utsteinense]|uniref:Transcriptional regulator, LacI family n=1 Tax=Abditibacterium utsteinense TaxID=1960156 RepID=A0A2S8SR72_9BACT|nr:LacI family DNA-binding transcriptional regulator [Abditibacterium utsteinense]PQV63285.1 transcriptional regulator, LacI family [Abditibacterium utsteinense]